MTEMRSLSDVYSDVCSENVNKGMSRLRVRLFNYTYSLPQFFKCRRIFQKLTL